MTDQNIEPRWSVTYVVHLDDKNGKTWGTLRYNSVAYVNVAEVVADFNNLTQHCYDVNIKGYPAFLQFPANEHLSPDSDFGFFAGVKAFQFSAVDLWENTNNAD